MCNITFQSVIANIYDSGLTRLQWSWKIPITSDTAAFVLWLTQEKFWDAFYFKDEKEEKEEEEKKGKEGGEKKSSEMT